LEAARAPARAETSLKQRLNRLLKHSDDRDESD